MCKNENLKINNRKNKLFRIEKLKLLQFATTKEKNKTNKKNISTLTMGFGIDVRSELIVLLLQIVFYYSY